MLWFLMGEVDPALGTVPVHLSFGAEQHYMRIQGRALTLLELWALHRGDDARGATKFTRFQLPSCLACMKIDTW